MKLKLRKRFKKYQVGDRVQNLYQTGLGYAKREAEDTNWFLFTPRHVCGGGVKQSVLSICPSILKKFRIALH